MVVTRFIEAPKINSNVFYANIGWGIQIRYQTNPKDSPALRKRGIFITKRKNMPLPFLKNAILTCALKMPEIIFLENFT